MHLFHRYNRHVNFIVLFQRRKTRPAMSDRFFVETPITGTRAELADAEARHLTGVLRAGVGDAVTLFDGSGAEFASRILRVGKSVVELEVLERHEISRELPLDLTLAVALPKGDRQKWLVEKLVELGVTRLVPLITERGVAQPVDSALTRLKRGVIEASKQCGRNKLMEIAEPRDASELFSAQPPGTLRLLAEPGGSSLSQLEMGTQKIVGAIGPEGGFTPAEVASALQAGWLGVSLGRSILRIETAAIALAAWGALR